MLLSSMVYKVVFFGGPGTGKTTMMEKFQERGYPVLPEVARELIIEEKLNFGIALPDVDMKSFQKKVFARQIEKEGQIDKYSGVVILDRGLDCVGYCRLGWLPSDPKQFPEREIFSKAVKEESKGDIIDRLKMGGYSDFIPAILETKYDLVFNFEPFSTYTVDEVRKEDYELASRIGEVVLDTYIKFGYIPITIREFSKDKEENIQMRLNFILDEIHKFKN